MTFESTNSVRSVKSIQNSTDKLDDLFNEIVNFDRAAITKEKSVECFNNLDLPLIKSEVNEKNDKVEDKADDKDKKSEVGKVDDKVESQDNKNETTVDLLVAKPDEDTVNIVEKQTEVEVVCQAEEGNNVKVKEVKDANDNQENNKVQDQDQEQEVEVEVEVKLVDKLEEKIEENLEDKVQEDKVEEDQKAENVELNVNRVI